MSHKAKLHPLSHKPFTGSVELIPPTPKFIEFIDAHRLWGFPIEHLAHFVLDENPEHHGKRTLPPHQLMLVYPDAVVILRGWRLELLVGPLVAGRIAPSMPKNISARSSSRNRGFPKSMSSPSTIPICWREGRKFPSPPEKRNERRRIQNGGSQTAGTARPA